MNTSQLKTYAPTARRNFIEAVSAQAARLGITDKGSAPAELQGDVLLVGGQAFPRTIASAREKLAKRVQKHGFEATMDTIAYTWFNRFVAIRYMELHGYLDHGYRVLSHPEGKPRPEILDHAADVDLSGLDRTRAIELKLDGTKDEELYRLLLKAQCNALHQAMPFLFERIGDETELLLPANLLNTDSLVRRMVEGIEESVWEQIEIIGWLYQFYISEKKDQVIGKVVKSEDIPAATQLFTPNWIVKYMVQNSLGAQWLATYPNSPLKKEKLLEYYIEPGDQTEEVEVQLESFTPRLLNPQELTFMDPACGSGHILVEAYDLYKAIYLERGHLLRDVAKFILEKNLFGLDIDERAAQLTGFALMMKGRADDRQLFGRGVKLNVTVFKSSASLDVDLLTQYIRMSDCGLELEDVKELKCLFEHADTFGSLIKVPLSLQAKLPAMKALCATSCEDLFVADSLQGLLSLVNCAEVLSTHYDYVISNPPYLGKGMNSLLRKFVNERYKRTKSDLFSVSTERFLELAKPAGFVGLMTPFTWMFLKSYEDLRSLVLRTKTLTSLVQPEYHAFFDSAYVPICSFLIRNCHISGYNSTFIKLTDFYGAELQSTKTLEAINNPDCGWLYRVKSDIEFKKLPGGPFAYWVSPAERDLYANGNTLDSVGQPRKGIDTGENSVFLRQWWEVSVDRCAFANTPAVEKWFPYNKGGDFRRWYGNREHVVNWRTDGAEIKSRLSWTKRKPTIRNAKHFFEQGFTWTTVSSGGFSIRYTPLGALFDNGGCTLFCEDEDQLLDMAALLNSKVAQRYLDFLSPTLNFQPGDVGKILYRPSKMGKRTQQLVTLARSDWDAYERSWEFKGPSIVLNTLGVNSPSLESAYASWLSRNCESISEVKELEEENNRLLIDLYGLSEELAPDIATRQVTLTVNPAYRYRGELTELEQQIRFRQDTMAELVSFAIGCMMGRYSLDDTGLIYAHCGNVNFDPSRFVSFPADDDGIIPLTDTEWFDDDATNRLMEFISVAWAPSHLEENLSFLANNLSPNKNESSRDTIRRYLCDSFFKDHLQTYKKRPIYWLFSSRVGLKCLDGTNIPLMITAAS